MEELYKTTGKENRMHIENKREEKQKKEDDQRKKKMKTRIK